MTLTLKWLRRVRTNW